MGKKISEDIINQIPILYKELGTKKAVAEKLGISSSTVSKYINLYEAAPQSAPPTTKRQKITLTEEQILEINQRYANCLNMAKIFQFPKCIFQSF